VISFSFNSLQLYLFDLLHEFSVDLLLLINSLLLSTPGFLHSIQSLDGLVLELLDLSVSLQLDGLADGSVSC